MVISGLVILVICTLTEYTVHRWFMHRRVSSFYKSHTVEHHGLGTVAEPRHADLTLRQGLFVFAGFLPVSLPMSYWVWPGYILVFAGVCLWWPLAWSATHRLIHGESQYWYARVLVPWYPLVASHHLRHHTKWTGNYGGIFFWSDWLFRTQLVGRPPRSTVVLTQKETH